MNLLEELADAGLARVVHDDDALDHARRVTSRGGDGVPWFCNTGLVVVRTLPPAKRMRFKEVRPALSAQCSSGVAEVFWALPARSLLEHKI
jgi:hypothetical protein